MDRTKRTKIIGAAMFRTGDTVLHKPTGECWLVALCEGDDLSWCGWPEGWAKASDCELIKVASDEEHLKLLRDIAAPGGHEHERDHRTRGARRILETMGCPWKDAPQ